MKFQSVYLFHFGGTQDSIQRCVKFLGGLKIKPFEIYLLYIFFIFLSYGMLAKSYSMLATLTNSASLKPKAVDTK